MTANGTAQYEYDGLNRRITKIANSIRTDYVYDGDEVIAEYNDSGGLAREYVLGEALDEVISLTTYNLPLSTDYYYQYDGLGSVSDLVDATGSVVESYDYDAYGNITSGLSTIGNPYYFTGRRLDTETGLYYYRNRMYDSRIGSFLQRDPIGMVDSTNLYEYVYNSPTNYIDPYGLYAAWVVQLLKNGGTKILKKITSKSEAVFLKKQGKDIIFSSKQKAKEAIKAATGGNKNVIKHKGHALANGQKGRPHFQSDDFGGHALWSGVGAFMLDLLDPFAPDTLANEDEDLDGNGVPDWMDEYDNNMCKDK
jgi:RHS repeat-associated protein